VAFGPAGHQLLLDHVEDRTLERISRLAHPPHRDSGRTENCEHEWLLGNHNCAQIPACGRSSAEAAM